MLIINNRDILLFSLPGEIPILDEFLNYFKIREGTSLAKTFERLYNYIFKGSFDLKEEYFNFFSKEYENFEVFLENYYGCFSEDDVSTILEEIKKKRRVFYTDTRYGIKSDSNIYRLMEDMYEEQRLLEMIEKFFKEYKNEDKN